MNFFSTQFLFQINRIQIELIDEAFLYIGIALAVLAVVFRLGARFAPSPVDAKYRSKFFKLFLTIGLFEVVWFGARAQLIRFFGTHFVALLVLLIGLVWLVWVVVKIIRNYRREKQVWEKGELKKKYLPW